MSVNDLGAVCARNFEEIVDDESWQRASSIDSRDFEEFTFDDDEALLSTQCDQEEQNDAHDYIKSEKAIDSLSAIQGMDNADHNIGDNNSDSDDTVDVYMDKTTKAASYSESDGSTND